MTFVDGKVTAEFAKMCMMLAEALGATVTPAQIRIHASLFNVVDAADLQRAFHQTALHSPRGFYPTPGEILSHIRPTQQDAALLAWSALNTAVISVGAYRDLCLSDHIAASALMSVFGSWSAFCYIEDGPELAMKRQEFLAAYRQGQRQHVSASTWTRLPGLTDTPSTLAQHVTVGCIDPAGRVLVVPMKDLPLLGSTYVLSSGSEG